MAHCWPNVLFLCVILNYVTVFGYNNCDKLKVFTGKKETQSNIFCTAEYSDDECLPFVQSFSRSDLPNEFYLSSLAVERPSEMNLVGLVNNITEGNSLFKTPGARVQWNSPIAEISRKHLEGFLLTWDHDANTTMCRLFKFKSESFDFLKMMTFSYDIDNLESDFPYTFTVYSVPPPDSQFRHDSNRYVQMMMHTFIKYKHATDPASWTPSVSMKTLPSGTIEVKFTLSPPEFNLTNFEIHLMKESNSINDYFGKKSYNGSLFTTLEPEGKVQFEGLSTDNYQIKVRIKDPFRNDESRCYCWKLEMNNILCHEDRCCSNTCGVMSTQWFHLKVTDALITKATPATHSVNVDPTTTKAAEVSIKVVKSDSLTGAEISAITIGVIITFTLIFLVFCYCKNCYCSQTYLKTLMCFKELPGGDKQSIFSITTQPFGSPAPLTTKKLYIMSADDHSCHIQMVKSLGQFLELHCQCQVVHPPTAQDIHKFDSPYTWFISNISSSDHIIFVTSVGAEKLMEAHLSHKTYRDRDLRPEGDLFTECLKYIFKDKKARDKVINIHFGETKMDSEYMKSAFTYSIPKHLPEFVLKLHALNSIDQQMYNSKLPLSRDNIQHLPAGAELLKAIRFSRHYEEVNPGWLITNFGHETEIEQTSLGKMTEIFHTSKFSPRLETMLSIDSGITDMGPRSVSASDFSNYPSPTTAEDYSSFCKNNDLIQNCESPLSIFTVQCSGVINDLGQNSYEDFKDQGCNFNIPLNVTETAKSDCPLNVTETAKSDCPLNVTETAKSDCPLNVTETAKSDCPLNVTETAKSDCPLNVTETAKSDCPLNVTETAKSDCPLNVTERAKSYCPNSDCTCYFSGSCKNFVDIAYDDCVFVLDNPSMDVSTKMTCREESAARSDPAIIYQHCLMSAFDVKPPETMSAITDLSGALWDVNTTNDYFESFHGNC